MAASKLHKHRGTCCTAERPYCPFAILCFHQENVHVLASAMNRPGLSLGGAAWLFTPTGIANWIKIIIEFADHENDRFQKKLIVQNRLTPKPVSNNHQHFQKIFS